MPATNAEKRKKFMENLKINGNFEAFKKKKAEHEKARRQRLKNSVAKLTVSKQNQLLRNSRLKCRERVRKCRAKKKGSTDSSHSIIHPNEVTDDTNDKNVMKSMHTPLQFHHSYKTYSALAKAATKTRKTLPASPTKRTAVIAKLVYSLDEANQLVIFNNRTIMKRGGNKGLSADLIEKIQLFYQRDDISRTSPNVKDTRYFVNSVTGKRELQQIRHLLVTLKQAYDLFGKENSGKPQVKLAKFCALRPNFVKLCGCMPNNVCVCIYHANFIEACTVLHKSVEGFPSYGPELNPLLVCCEFQKDCWFKTCAECSPKKIEAKLLNMIAGSGHKVVKWLQWKHDKVKNRTQRHEEHGTVKILMEYFISIYKEFLKHSFTKTQQSEDFNIDRDFVNSEANEEECLLQVDYAENHKCESQDEAHTAHWNQQQVSVFTGALHYMGRTHAMVKVSDNLDHSKDTLVPFIYSFLSKLPKAVKVVRLWTDGPTSQFKNKFVTDVMILFQKLFNIKIFWNFFPTAHGKGCVDGIGAVVKSKVRRLVKARKFIVNNAKEFVGAFNSEKSSIDVEEMSASDIQLISDRLNLAQIFSKSPAVKNITKFHQMQIVNNSVKGFLTSKEGYATSESRPKQ